MGMSDGLGAALGVALSVTLVGCGADTNEPSEPRILHGVLAEEGLYDAVFSLHVQIPGTNAFTGSVCTGTLIAPHTILTAAHCVTVFDESTLFVYVPGVLRVQSSVDGTELDPDLALEIAEVTVHPGYSPTWGYDDLAVLRLATSGLEASGGSMVRPLDALSEDHIGLPRGLDIIGFGRTAPPPAPFEEAPRMHATVAMTQLGCSDYVECQFDDVKFSWDNTADGGACLGDSGGPVLVFHDASGSPTNAEHQPTPGAQPTPPGGTARLAGVISGGSSTCAGQSFATRVDTSAGWLARYLSDLDGSGAMSLADFNLFKAAFLSNDPVGDLDGSGTVDLADFAIFKAGFQAGYE